MLRITHIPSAASNLLSFETDSEALNWLALFDGESKTISSSSILRLESEIVSIRMRMSEAVGGFDGGNIKPSCNLRERDNLMSTCICANGTCNSWGKSIPTEDVQRLVAWLSRKAEEKEKQIRTWKASFKSASKTYSNIGKVVSPPTIVSVVPEETTTLSPSHSAGVQTPTNMNSSSSRHRTVSGTSECSSVTNSSVVSSAVRGPMASPRISYPLQDRISSAPSSHAATPTTFTPVASDSVRSSWKTVVSQDSFSFRKFGGGDVIMVGGGHLEMEIKRELQNRESRAATLFNEVINM